MSDDDPQWMTAADLRAGYAAGSFSPVEIAEGLVRLCERAFGVPKELRKLG